MMHKPHWVALVIPDAEGRFVAAEHWREFTYGTSCWIRQNRF